MQLAEFNSGKAGVQLLVKTFKFSFSIKNELPFWIFTLLICTARSVLSQLVQSDEQSLPLTADCSWFTALVACGHLLLLQLTAPTSCPAAIRLF